MSLLSFLSGILSIALLIGPCCALFLGLLNVLSSDQLTERTHLVPNEGIWRSAKNGLVLGIVFGLPMGLLAWLLMGLPSSGFVGPSDRFLFGLFVSLLAWLLIGLFVGLGAFAQHFILRIMLWRTNAFPWPIIIFLDEAAEHLFLRKVGGNYTFVHGRLQEYFANLDASTWPAPTTEQTKAALKSLDSPGPERVQPLSVLSHP